MAFQTSQTVGVKRRRIPGLDMLRNDGDNSPAQKRLKSSRYDSPRTGNKTSDIPLKRERKRDHSISDQIQGSNEPPSLEHEPPPTTHADDVSIRDHRHSREASAHEIREQRKKKKNKEKPSPNQGDTDSLGRDLQADRPPVRLSRTHKPSHMPTKPDFPFYSQTVSLYVPIAPVGWDDPILAVEKQFFLPLVNKYFPALKGILLAYNNIVVSDAPGSSGPALSDDGPADLISMNECAMGFAWITVDVDVFVPRRGAWMEGEIILQNEAQIGVVCRSKFNASIDARRLPESWKWVSMDSESAIFHQPQESTTNLNGTLVIAMHPTGFWADGQGREIIGNLRFRIRDFEVGNDGETGYLSLEGTLLDDDGEGKVAAEEEAQRTTDIIKRSVRPASGRQKAPADFSMTKLGAVQHDDERSVPQKRVWQATQPREEDL